MAVNTHQSSSDFVPILKDYVRDEALNELIEEGLLALPKERTFEIKSTYKVCLGAFNTVANSASFGPCSKMSRYTLLQDTSGYTYKLWLSSCIQYRG